jgi:transposase
VVAAALEGGQSRDAVARRFAVGRSSVCRWVETAQAEGRLEAKPMRGGPKPTIRDEALAALKRLVKAENPLTLAECRDRLAEETGVRVHPWMLGRAMRRLGLTRKKRTLRAELVLRPAQPDRGKQDEAAVQEERQAWPEAMAGMAVEPLCLHR